MKVLIFETSKDRAKLISDLLTDYRYKVYIHDQSQQAVNEVRNIKPALIIVNANMQPEYGINIIEKIKKDSRLRKIPVILISNFVSTELSEKIKQYPNVDYLVEPFKIKKFRHMVERWINFRSLYVN